MARRSGSERRTNGRAQPADVAYDHRWHPQARLGEPWLVEVQPEQSPKLATTGRRSNGRRG